MVVEAVVEDDDLAQVDREFIDHVVEAIINLTALGVVIEVRSRHRRGRREDLLWRRVDLGYLLPDVTGDGGPGVSGEGRATVRIEVLDSLPKTDATGLQQLIVGK